MINKLQSMSIDDAAKEIFLRRSKLISKQELATIIKYSQLYKIDKCIIMGILLIEKSFRPFPFVCLEYIAFIFEYMLNKLFRIPIKNYTLSRFQIGISSMLFYSKCSRYKLHSRKLNNLSLKEFKVILSSINFENSTNLFCLKLIDIQSNIEKHWGRTETNVGRIGEKYNGNIKYGFLLMELYKRLKNLEKSDL